MKVTPIAPTQPTTQPQQQTLKPTDKPTFQECLLLAFANGKERTR